MLERRSTATAGWVNFPISHPAYSSAGEGGTVVKLVVIDPHDMDSPKHFAKCLGAQVRDVLSESLVGDDQAAYPDAPDLYQSVADVQAEEKARVEWARRHYPAYRDSSCEPIESVLSRDYLAAIVLGSSGWSGRSVATGENWACTVEDLTEQGKVLYEQIAALYPNATLHLLTFLDT